jgi:hypothetical protein
MSASGLPPAQVLVVIVPNRFSKPQSSHQLPKRQTRTISNMEQFMATGFPNKRQKIANPEDVRLWEGLVSSLKVPAENKDVIFAEIEKAIAINREASPHIAREMDRLARVRNFSFQLCFSHFLFLLPRFCPRERVFHH